MNTILDKEPVKRAEKSLKKFDEKLEVIFLKFKINKNKRTAKPIH